MVAKTLRFRREVHFLVLEISSKSHYLLVASSWTIRGGFLFKFI